MIQAVTLGIPELDDNLSYLATKAADRIARRAIGKAADVTADYIRRAVRLNVAGRDRGIGSRNARRRGLGILSAKAGVAVGKAGRVDRVLNRGRKKGVGLSGRNLHWFAAGTTDRWTGTRTSKTKQGGKRSKPTGNPRHFTGRIDKLKFGGFVQAGAAAAELHVRGLMEKIVAEGVEKEMASRNTAMRMGGP